MKKNVDDYTIEEKRAAFNRLDGCFKELKDVDLSNSEDDMFDNEKAKAYTIRV